ncbi:MAG: hypothetical protein B9S32_01105 [Verrucomicrobia bacterium Tous-C9LFEB]|nr:MAG: hypothetical protein B9S32_01105 [Verrucomicrobia bacterium Tous-C9LFEB]
MSTLTHKQRVHNAIKWKPVDRLPVFTGGTFPKLIGRNYNRDYLHDADAIAQTALKQWEVFEADAVGVGSGGSLEVLANAKQVWPENDYPMFLEPVIKSREDVDNLHVPTEEELAKDERVAAGLKAIQIVRKALGPDVPLTGMATGAFNSAGKLTGTSELMRWLAQDPELVWQLNLAITQTTINHVKLQVKAGIDIIHMPDATSSPACISPKQFTKHALPHHKAVIQAIHDAGAIAKFHPCGGEYPIIDQLAETKADILHFTELVDLGVAQKIFVQRHAVAGGVDIVTGPLFLGGPDEVDAYIKTLIEGLKFKTGTLIMPSCGLSPNIPIENIVAYVKAVKKYSKGSLR